MNIKQRKAVELLSIGTTVRQTAKAVGCSPAALLSWKKNREFAKELEKVKQSTAEQLRKERETYNQLLFVSAIEAVQTLLELLKSDNEFTKLAAAQELLDRWESLPKDKVQTVEIASFNKETAYSQICEQVYGIENDEPDL